MNIRTCSISFSLLAMAILPLAGCSSNSSTSLDTAQQLVQRLETAETGAMPGMTNSTLTADLESAGQSVESHLDSNPDDPQALLLAARIGRLQQMTVPVTLGAGEPALESSRELEMLHAYVDRVLVNDPTNAEAHHCKALLFGTRRPVVRGRSVSYMTSDLTSASASAQTAVDLEPNNMTYRQTLANMLIAEGSFDAAVEMLSEYPGSQNPQCQVLNGFGGFTVPSEAVFLGDESLTFGLRQIRAGKLSDFPQARVRIFAVPSSRMEIEEFYNDHWPRFSFFPQAQEGLYTQFLASSMGGNDLSPAMVAGSVPTLPTTQRGLMLSVIEMYNPPADKWRQAIPDFEAGDHPGPVMSYICVVNCSPVESN